MFLAFLELLSSSEASVRAHLCFCIRKRNKTKVREKLEAPWEVGMLRIDPWQFGEFVYCEGRCSGGVVELSGPWDLHIPALNQALLGAFGAFPNPHLV